MKTKNIILIIVATTLMFVASCKKDEPDPEHCWLFRWKTTVNCSSPGCPYTTGKEKEECYLTDVEAESKRLEYEGTVSHLDEHNNVTYTEITTCIKIKLN